MAGSDNVDNENVQIGDFNHYDGTLQRKNENERSCNHRQKYMRIGRI